MAEPRLRTGLPVGARARGEACPLAVQPCRELRQWLHLRAQVLNHELGAEIVTPAHIVHRILMDAMTRERRALLGGAR